jgi:calcium-dependent protein kinase
MLLDEVEILKKLDHPNIVKIYELYSDEDYFYIVTEKLTGGDVFSRMK